MLQQAQEVAAADTSFDAAARQAQQAAEATFLESLKSEMQTRVEVGVQDLA